MRLAPAIGALLCASVLVLAGCSSAAEDGAQITRSAQDVGESSAENKSSAATDDAAGDTAAHDAVSGSEVADTESDTDPETAMADFDALFGEGGCMEVANVLMGWGFALLGPLMEGTTLTQQDADEMFPATGALPAEIEAHVAVLRTAIDGAVGKPQSTVIEIVGSPEVTDAMNGLTAYSENLCGGESAG